MNFFNLKNHQAWLFLGLFCCSLQGFAATSEANTTSAAASLEPSQYLWQIAMSLIFILLIIFAAAWMLKRFGKVNGVAGEQMKILGVMTLGQRERVVLMSVGKQQLLIGVTASRVSLLYELEEPVDIESEKPVRGAFAARLEEAMSRKKSTPVEETSI